MLVKQSIRLLGPVAHTHLLPTKHVAHFEFKSIQLLDFSTEDNPKVFFEGDKLVISAERGGEVLMVSTPMPGEQRIAKVQTQVKKPKRKMLASSGKRYPLPTQQVLPATDSRVGENSKLAKLNEEKVKEIKQFLNDPKTLDEFSSWTNAYIQLGRMYNVHFTTISNIAKNRTWKHVSID